MARIVLAMSGGVDSSVAAHLLRAAGHEVIGVFMRHGETVEAACSTAAPARRASEGESKVDSPSLARRANDAAASRAKQLLPVISARADHKQGCCSASDATDARRVADQKLDIPFYALDMSDEFGRIIDYFVAEYRQARTPNPCVVCNNWLKFGKLFDYADSVGAKFVATGHYARLDRGLADRRQRPVVENVAVTYSSRRACKATASRFGRWQRSIVRAVRRRAATAAADDASRRRLSQA